MILDSLVTGRRKFAVGRVFYAGDVVLDRPVRALEARRRPGDKFGAYTNIDRASRLLGWGPRYDIVDGIRHSLQWAAMRDDLPSVGGDGRPKQRPWPADQLDERDA